MSKITSEILAKIAPGTPQHLRDRFIPYYNECMPRYGIVDRLEVAAYLTTVCFESDYFKALAEYASGWDYDISRNPKKARTLGNYSVGDGPRYKGAGGIETTGKYNYQRLTDRLGVDFVNHPELLRTEKYFVEAACVFWDDHDFNALADRGEITLIENITNRGSGDKTAKALNDRLVIYRTVLAVLPKDFTLGGALPAEGSAAVSTGQAVATPVDGTPSPDKSPAGGDSSGVQEQPPTIVSEQSSDSNGWLDKFKFWKSKADDAQTQISGVQDTLSNVGNKLSPVSKSSWAMVLWTKVMGWGMLALGYYNQHRFGVAVMVIGLVLIVAALAYLHFAKQRGRNGGTSQVQQQKVVINPTSSAGEAA